MGEAVDRYRKEKGLIERVRHLDGVQYSMTLSEYIRYKNPKTVEDVEQIIRDNFLNDPEVTKIPIDETLSWNEMWRMVYKAEIIMCKTVGAQYIGVKIKVTSPAGDKWISPPGDEVIRVPRTFKLNGKNSLTIKGKKYDGIGSIHPAN